MSAVEPGRQFLDTNVLVYAHDATAGAKRSRALKLVEDLWESGEGCLSLQVLQEFFVTMTRKVARPLPHPVAAGLVEKLGTWTTHSPTTKDLLAAIDLYGRRKISLWDALVVRSASQLGCRVLWTEDLKDGETYDGVRIRNPFR
jgi:predicted nucleic acid-binding protein